VNVLQFDLFCKNCGHEMSSTDNNFCSKCGKSVNDEKESIREPTKGGVSLVSPVNTPRSYAWYLLPIVLGLLGGVIAYFVLRK